MFIFLAFIALVAGIYLFAYAMDQLYDFEEVSIFQEENISSDKIGQTSIQSKKETLYFPKKDNLDE